MRAGFSLYYTIAIASVPIDQITIITLLPILKKAISARWRITSSAPEPCVAGDTRDTIRTVGTVCDTYMALGGIGVVTGRAGSDAQRKM